MILILYDLFVTQIVILSTISFYILNFATYYEIDMHEKNIRDYKDIQLHNKTNGTLYY